MQVFRKRSISWVFSGSDIEVWNLMWCVLGLLMASPGADGSEGSQGLTNPKAALLSQEIPPAGIPISKENVWSCIVLMLSLFSQLFPWYLRLAAVWHCATFAGFLCCWMRPTDKQPLFASYQSTVTLKALQSRCCICRCRLDMVV